MEKVIDLDNLGELETPLHTDAVIYPDGRTSDREEPTKESQSETEQ